MNEFVWVCGEATNVVDFFCWELQLKDLQVATLSKLEVEILSW